MPLNLENRTYNFAAGPSMLPGPVMQKAYEEFFDFYCGMSALEINHREQHFTDLIDNLNSNLIKLLNIPPNYKILWTTGGATLHFSLIPLNLAGVDSFALQCDPALVADYLCTGHWSEKSASNASKYITVNRVVDSCLGVNENGKYIIPDVDTWRFSGNPLYTYYTPNETLFGLEFDALSERYLHNFCQSNHIPLVADMTSSLLSKPIDVSNYGLIYASAQKNMGISGLTVVIIRDDLLKSVPNLPEVCSYKLLAEHNSILNTPPTYNIYITHLVVNWLIEQGGLEAIYASNLKKAKTLYDYIDSEPFYVNKIKSEYRSKMNVTFNIKNAEYNSNYNSKLDIETEFLTQARDHKLFNLGGHRFIGGMRASIYNSMPIEGVYALIEFMKNFADNSK